MSTLRELIDAYVDARLDWTWNANHVDGSEYAANNKLNAALADLEARAEVGDAVEAMKDGSVLKASYQGFEFIRYDRFGGRICTTAREALGLAPVVKP